MCMFPSTYLIALGISFGDVSGRCWIKARAVLQERRIQLRHGDLGGADEGSPLGRRAGTVECLPEGGFQAGAT